MFKSWLQKWTETPRSKRRPRARRRTLRLEKLDKREVLAGNLGAIAGTAFIDLLNDGLTADDPRLGGAEVRLWRDGGDGVFGGPDVAGDDLLVDIVMTGALEGSNPGEYLFNGLTSGLYFVEQLAGPATQGYLIPDPVAINVIAEGQTVRTIDSFSQTNLTLEVTAGDPLVTSIAEAPDAVGGIRKAELTYTQGPSTVQAFVDNVTERLGLSSAFASFGTLVLRYDGDDSTIDLVPDGLGGENLSNGDPNAGILIEVFQNLFVDDQTYSLAVYSDATNFSTIEVPFREELVGTIYREIIPFANFVTAGGEGADFESVGAIELIVSNTADQNIRITIFDSRETRFETVDLATRGVTLGNQIFLDANNDGIFDPLTETGISDVPVELYRLDSIDAVVDPLTQTPIATTTSDVDGNYQFTGLPSGFYAAVVPATAFATGEALAGFFSSQPDPPSAGAAAKIDNDDDGRVVPGQAFVITETFELEVGEEPAGDGLVNNTVDFGFLAIADLGIEKELVSLADGTDVDFVATFEIMVINNGTLDSTGVTVIDTVPEGLVFRSIGSIEDPSVAPEGVVNTTVDGDTVTFQLIDLPAGESTGFVVMFDIAGGQFGERVNRATVSSDQADLVPDNNTAEATVLLRESDLEIVKSVETLTGEPIPPSAVLTGDEIIYRLVVTNNGPDAATGVTVVDTLPIDVTFIEATIVGQADGEGISFDAGTRQVTASLGTLEDAATATVLILVSVNPGAAGAVTNSATVSASPQTDPDLDNNTSEAGTAIARAVDLAIDKSLADGSVVEFGGTASFVITVTNVAGSPGNARGFTVTDVLPEGLTYLAGSFDSLGSDVEISVDGSTLTFTGVPLAVAESVSFRFDASVAQSAAASIINTATVTPFVGDGVQDADVNSANDQDSETVIPIRSVDLVVTKTDGIAAGGSHVPGTPLTYSITITNTGVSDAVDVNVVDILPAGVVATSITIAGEQVVDNDPDQGRLNFVIPLVPTGQENAVTVQVSTQVGGALTGSITNTVTISGGGVNDPPAGNEATVTTTLSPDFDVTLSKTVPETPVVPGQGTIAYTIVVSNSGPSVANAVTLNDTLPAGLQLQSITLDGTEVPNQGTGNNVQLVFPTLLPGTAGARTVVITAAVTAAATGPLVNEATVEAIGDRDTENNSSSATVPLTPEANFEVEKRVSAANAAPGTELTYTIDVINNGPSNAAGVTLIDVLPAGVTFVSGSGPNGNGSQLTADGQTVEVEIGVLAPGVSQTYTIVARINDGFSGNLENIASVTATTPQGDESNPSSLPAVTQVAAVDPNTSVINGRAFIDRNGDGLFNNGDVGVAGLTVRLLTAGTGDVVQTTTTDALGNYRFQNLPEGTYDIELELPPGLESGLESLNGGTPAELGDGKIPGVAVGQADLSASNTFALIARPSKRDTLASAN
ncbi:MAG: DUF11 domain-containing protein [Planctomycetaceae bacterium]|nr:MAG: DUF11 domain-containing protein [Planctomycetaceae bacterium]